MGMVSKGHLRTIAVTMVGLTAHPVFAQSVKWAELAKGLGVQATYLVGSASVETGVTHDGNSSTVASGDASQRQLMVSLTRRQKTGLTLYISPHFLSTSVHIADFSGGIEINDVQDAEEIPAIESDFETGLAVNGADPNKYGLGMDAVGLNVGASYTTIWTATSGERPVYVGFYGAVNALQYGRAQVSVGSQEDKHTRFDWAASYTAGGRMDHMLDALGSMISFEVSWIYYPAIALPQKLEFRDKIRFNESKESYERRRIFVDELTLRTFNVGLSYTYFM